MWGNRETIRHQFIEAWRKANQGLPLSALESHIVEVIQEHPEYHTVLATPELDLHHDYTPERGEQNPFLHLALHLSLREQAAVDLPPGIRAAYQRLSALLGKLEAEHRMLECLGQSLWESQRFGREPDTQAYLDCIRRIF